MLKWRQGNYKLNEESEVDDKVWGKHLKNWRYSKNKKSCALVYIYRTSMAAGVKYDCL